MNVRVCPLCKKPEPHISVQRPSIPVFQNIVYPSHEAAISAPQAPFVLGTCVACGFSFNAVFDASLVDYNEEYDNQVVSETFTAYYRELALMLIKRLDLNQGMVYDIGCGNGEFLRLLCSLAPGIHGVGIDPSCTPIVDGNFELIRARFAESIFGGDVKLVLLRHVLEHIDHPLEFLSNLRRAMPQAPLFVEVPDLNWILENTTFWDFCYEHCNYFTQETLGLALSAAGFSIISRQRSFGNQYQWALCAPSRALTLTPEHGFSSVKRAEVYARREAGQIEQMRARAAGEAGGICIWGMATKGVMLSVLVGADNIRGGIDMNPAKQGRFAAATGVPINPPDWLATLTGTPTILVMNPNYYIEIAAMMNARGYPFPVQAV